MIPHRTLFAYFEDADLGEAAAEYEDLLRDFVAEQAWRGPRPFVVHQRQVSPARPGAAPAWDLGLHLVLPRPGQEPVGWFADVERVVALLQRLYAERGLTFVLGVFDSEGGYAEDLCYIDRPEPDLDALRERALGVPRQEDHDAAK